MAKKKKPAPPSRKPKKPPVESAPAGELSPEELDNVSGGTLTSAGGVFVAVSPGPIQSPVSTEIGPGPIQSPWFFTR